MNNKGQTLTAFIVLLPLIFMIFALILDLGLLYTEKQKINSNIKEAINYGLKNQEEKNLENKLNILINRNVKNIKNIDINIKENMIEITVSKKYISIFKHIFKKASYDIRSKYKGYLNNDKIEINKEV